MYFLGIHFFSRKKLAIRFFRPGEEDTSLPPSNLVKGKEAKGKMPTMAFSQKEKEKCTFLLFPLSLKEVLKGINMKTEGKVKKDTLL